MSNIIELTDQLNQVDFTTLLPVLRFSDSLHLLLSCENCKHKDFINHILEYVDKKLDELLAETIETLEVESEELETDAEHIVNREIQFGDIDYQDYINNINNTLFSDE